METVATAAILQALSDPVLLIDGENTIVTANDAAKTLLGDEIEGRSLALALRQPEVLEYTDIRMDLARHRVTRQGKWIHLGPTEFRLLRVLMERPTRVFSREQLLDRAWGRDVYVESRTVDVHIRRLRKALNISGSKDIIRTVRGSGYTLDESSYGPRFGKSL